ncbi:extracellular calcium-sensing receptor-like [Ambystoma mexicanum]|uniref:extracellular calcium-sensing receptor-like n=1 Tax=Ambystoma mexicanum TaxID=8296 RepID=UPI0037E92416
MCQLRSSEAIGFSMKGDILIGGVFQLHVDRVSFQYSFEEEPSPAVCRTFIFQNYQWLQAMLFAIEEINGNYDILPNVTLGFQTYDSCADPLLALQGTLWMLTGQNKHIPNYSCQRDGHPAGIVGDAGSLCSIPIARLLGLYRQPQISYFSTNPFLSDRNQFPSFFRTIPSDDFQSRGLAQLVIHYNWTWVGLLAEDNEYGKHGVEILQAELHKAGACVAFSESIILSRPDRNAYHIAQVISSSTANAIVIFGLDSHLVPLFDEILEQNITGKVFIASEAWSTSALLSVEKYVPILSGTIGLAIYSGEMPGFKEYLNRAHPATVPGDIFIRDFWEAAFSCKWEGSNKLPSSWNNQSSLCTGDENMESVRGIYNDVTTPRVTYNVYRAVYAIALALHNLNSCKTFNGPSPHGTCAHILDFQPWQLLHYIKDVHLPNSGNEQGFFDSSGNPLAQYDIVHWQQEIDGTLNHRIVGIYDSSASSGKSLQINSATIWWSGSREIPGSMCNPSCPPGFRKAAKEGEPICCFMCILCPQGEIAKEIDSVECSKCPWDQWPNLNQNRCLLKPVQFLSYQEPLGTFLVATSGILSIIPAAILGLFVHYRNTPIVKANNCFLSYLLLLSLILCFLCSLVFIGYPTSEKCLLRQAAFGINFTLCVSFILAKTIMVVIAFNATNPTDRLRRWVGPRLSYVVISVCTLIQVLICVSWLILSPPFSEYNIHTQLGIVIVECNEGSPTAFWCMLGYLGLLATVSFMVAFLARKLPDSFNEAKFITFSMLAFLSVWISFIPAYLSTKGKYMVAMEIFAILSSSSSLVSCIFFPKCYIILLRPEMNTKEYLMGREASNRTKMKAS